MNTKNGILLVCVALLVFYAFVGPVSAADIYVPDDYAKIQWAVDNAMAGDTIIVRDGTYTENVVVNVAHLAIQSENGSASTIVSAAISNIYVFKINADYVNISDFTVRGAKNAAGIYLEATYCNISNSTCSNNFYGIYLENSSNNTISNNICTNNEWGIDSWGSNNILSNNTCTNNTYVGIYLWYSEKNFVSNNNCSNNGIGIYLYYKSNNNTLENNNVSTNGDGIRLYNSLNNKIGNNNVSNNDFGIYLQKSLNNNIENNTANLNNWNGIHLLDSKNNKIESNNASNNFYGIKLYNSSDIIIEGNNVNSNNEYGIRLEYSSNNRLSKNNVLNNTYGISLAFSDNNFIYNNYFNNTNNAWDNGNNIWNITKTFGTNIIGGSYLGGNYWSDYAGEDLDGDGLGDTLLPYNSSGYIQNGGDYLPLVKPAAPSVFDTAPSKNPYPSIMGTHKGEIEPSCNINVSKLYTYSCVGTGGHTKSIKLEENGIPIANGTWNGYQDDYHSITIHNVSGASYVMLYKGHKYNYTIVTGSYPQIIHEPSKEVTGGTITCTLFTDANGKTYTDWIPAIRLE